MEKIKRIPQAPTDPMPELAEFLAQFQVHFNRRESRHATERYLTGLLTEHPNKNCDTLASVVPQTSEQSLQGLVTVMAWDENDLNQQRVKVMRTLPTEGNGVLLFDDTDFPKQGHASVGVARQYSGSLGKIANCQVTVNCTYAERTLAWPIATRLYLPHEWITDPERRKRAHVPPEVVAQTKWEIALDFVDQANTWGVRHACVVCDAGYGDNPPFLDGLEVRHERYVAAIRADFTVATSRTAPPQRTDQLLALQPKRAWVTLHWKEGSTGWLKARFIAIRCWRIDGQGQRRIGWLIGQRPAHGAVGDWKYFWSNYPRHTALSVMVEYAHRRHWVEQYHEEAKTELGWAQYPGRLWTGFHRNAVVGMLSFSFLVWLEFRLRQQQSLMGRPRRAFSPSAG
jgi:SRSO17 transposase